MILNYWQRSSLSHLLWAISDAEYDGVLKELQVPDSTISDLKDTLKQARAEQGNVPPEKQKIVDAVTKTDLTSDGILSVIDKLKTLLPQENVLPPSVYDYLHKEFKWEETPRQDDLRDITQSSVCGASCLCLGAKVKAVINGFDVDDAPSNLVSNAVKQMKNWAYGGVLSWYKDK